MPPPSTGRGGFAFTVGHTHPCAFGVGVPTLSPGRCACPSAGTGSSSGGVGLKSDDCGGDGACDDLDEADGAADGRAGDDIDGDGASGVV
jgi:hypothetical protein